MPSHNLTFGHQGGHFAGKPGRTFCSCYPLSDSDLEEYRRRPGRVPGGAPGPMVTPSRRAALGDVLRPCGANLVLLMKSLYIYF